MQLAEFTAAWFGNYTHEQKESYRIVYGDDENAWPPTPDEAPIVIDLDMVCRFNPHHDEEKTTVELRGGMSYALLISYEEFKSIMNTVAMQNLILDYKKTD